MSLASCLSKATALRPETRSRIESRALDLRRNEGLDEQTAAERAVQEVLGQHETEMEKAGDKGYLDTQLKKDGEERFLHKDGPKVNQIETPEFTKWFVRSKVVDENGKPLVMYHGTNASQNGDAFTMFDTYASNYGLMGMGGYFTADPTVAASYTEKGKGDTPTVYATYLSIKNPLDMDAKADPSLWAKQFPDVASYHEGGDTNESWYRAAEASLSERGLPKWEGAEIMQDGLRAMGFDGITHMGGGRVRRDSVRHRVFIAFDPEQIKSAIGNNGQFDPANPDIRFQKDEGFDLPEFGRFSKTVQTMQDQYRRWKEAIDAVREQGGEITEANDFYRAEERMHGRTAAELEDLGSRVQDFLKEIRKDGLKLKGVEEYAYAQYARFRNAAIAKKRGAEGDWSGMSDADAEKILAEAKANPKIEEKLLKHADTLRALAQANLQKMYDGGLITKEQFDTWSKDRFYIPLKGKPGADGKMKGVGGGLDIRGKETHEAKGRRSRAKDILAHIIQDSTRTIIRVQKNQVARSFGQFVMDNPDPKLWAVASVETKPVVTLDEEGNRVIEEQEVPVTDQGRTVAYKDGGRAVHVEVKDPALIAAFKNLNHEQLNRLTAANLWVNRWLARSYTSLNPVFPLINFTRDLQGAILGATADFAKEQDGVLGKIGGAATGAGRLLVNLPGAFLEAGKAEFGGQPSQRYQEFRYSGAKAGFIDMRSIEDIAKVIQAQVNSGGRSLLDPRSLPSNVAKLLEGINGVFENATRFAYYKAARQAGRSPAAAASLAKNSTVNFNRKGTAAPQMGWVMLFYNPAVQGMVRTGQILTSPVAGSLVGAAMTGAFFLALQNASAGDDDDGVAWWDKIPDDVKERNLVIVLPPTINAGESVPGSKTGRYIKIPLHYGLNFFAVVANAMADVKRNHDDAARGKTLTRASSAIAMAFMRSWVPYDTLASAFDDSRNAPLMALSPAAQIAMRPAMNVGPFGRQLYPDTPQDRNMPDSTKFYAGQAGTIWQRSAEWMNEFSGGNKFQSGWADFTPGTLEYLTRAIAGGQGSFVLDLVNSVYARQSIERPDLDARRLPFVKQAIGTIDAENDRERAMKSMDAASKIIDPIEAAIGKDNAAARKMRDENPEIFALAGKLDAIREQLGTLKKKDLAIIDSQDSDALKYAKLQANNLKRRQVLMKWNEAYNGALRRAQTREGAAKP